MYIPKKSEYLLRVATSGVKMSVCSVGMLGMSVCSVFFSVGVLSMLGIF